MTQIYYLISYFTIYSFIGWVAETVYCSIPQKKFVYRGFLNGPFCPIYGFGAIALIITLSVFKDSIFTTFSLSIIITSILEYIASYILEFLFNTKLWDYSHKRFNINGRVCLQNSILFGIMAVIFIYFIHPILSNSLHYKLSDTLIKYISITFLCYFIIDSIVSIYTVLKINNTLKQIYNNQSISKPKPGSSPLIQGAIRPSIKLLYKRVFRAFPNMKSNLNHDALSKLIDYIKNQ